MMDGSYRFFGYGASVRVDAPAGIELVALRSQVAPEIAAEAHAGGRSDLHLTRWKGEYHLTYGERRYGPYRTLTNALRGLSYGIHFLVGKRSPLTFLHAGAIEIDGAAVVFPCRSRWAKNTLVSSLVQQGCGYLSDEYAVVSPEGAVFPLSRPIQDWATDGYASAPGGFRCSGVFFTRYEEGAEWEARPLTPGEAALETLSTALQGCEYPDKVRIAVTALVRNAACYRSTRGCGGLMVETLRDLLQLDGVGQEARA